MGIVGGGPYGFTVTDCISAGNASSPANEDACGWTSNTAWVIDGGTSLDGSSEFAITSGRWFAQTASRHLQVMGGDVECLNDILVSVARELAKAWPLYKNKSDLLPAVGCLAIAQLSKAGAVELGAVGDCTAVLWNRDGQEKPTAVITDSVLEDTERKWRKAATSKESPLKDISAHRYHMIANRLGYIKGEPAWIMSTDPIAAELASAAPTITVPVEPGAVLLLATDGFTRALTLPAFKGDWSVLLEKCVEDGLAAVLQRLRDTETSDPEFTANKHKTTDDATALLLTVG